MYVVKHRETKQVVSPQRKHLREKGKITYYSGCSIVDYDCLPITATYKNTWF